MVWVRTYNYLQYKYTHEIYMGNPTLKVLSSEMNPAEIRLILQKIIKGNIAAGFQKNPPVSHRVRARAPSRTIIGYQALNGQMCSKAHSTLTAPLVLHHTRIYKCAMKKFCFNFQMWNEPFMLVIYHSSLVKGAMNAERICKLRNGVIKMPQFLLFSQAKGGTKTISHLSIAEGSNF